MSDKIKELSTRCVLGNKFDIFDDTSLCLYYVKYLIVFRLIICGLFILGITNFCISFKYSQMKDVYFLLLLVNFCIILITKIIIGIAYLVHKSILYRTVLKYINNQEESDLSDDLYMCICYSDDTVNICASLCDIIFTIVEIISIILCLLLVFYSQKHIIILRSIGIIMMISVFISLRLQKSIATVKINKTS